MFVGSTAFLLFKANSIEEYGQSFYLTALSLLLLFLWPCFIHNMDDLFNLMDEMDKFEAKRMSTKSSARKSSQIILKTRNEFKKFR